MSIEKVIQLGLNIQRDNLIANTLVPLAALVDKGFQGQGLSSTILVEMKRLAIQSELTSLVVPVHPIMKSKYPTQSIHDYVQWRGLDGYFYDPWLRVHEKLGAEVIKVADCTLKVTGSLDDWSKWINMIFPISGGYIVKGALSPVHVAQNRGYCNLLRTKCMDAT